MQHGDFALQGQVSSVVEAEAVALYVGVTEVWAILP